MPVFLMGYAGLLLAVGILVVWFLKTGLWHRRFLFFVHLLSFSVLNVAGMYALVHSVYMPVPALVDPERVLLGFFIVYVSFLLFLPLYLWNGSRRRLAAVDKGLRSGQREIGGPLTVLLLWLVSLSIVGLHALSGGQYPLLLVLQNQGAMTAGAMVELRQQLGFVGFQWFNIGFYLIPNFLLVYTFLLWRTKHSLVHTVLFGGTALLSALLSVLFLFKGWVFWLVAALVIAKVVVDRKIGVRAIAFLLVGVAAVGVFYKFYSPTVGPLAIARTLTHRILEAYPMGSGVAFGAFPDVTPFLGGSTLPNPGGLLPFQNVNLPAVTHYFLYGSAGSAPVPNAVEGYVNFGYTGLALFAMFGQWCVFALSSLIGRMRQGAFATSVFVFASIWVIHLSLVSIFYGLLDLTVIATFVTVLAIRQGVVLIFMNVRIRQDAARDNDKTRRLACPIDRPGLS